MTDEIVFYTNPWSRGRIVRWMLEEIGCAYRTEVVEYGPTMKAPAYLAVNPMGKVPAITHGGTIVTETAAICAYLADAFPQARLAPAPQSRERAPYYRWLFFAAGPLEQGITLKSLGVEVPDDKKPMAGCGTLTEAVAAIERALDGRDYIAGDSFTAADLYVGAHLGWGMQFGTLEKRPALERYAARLYARPAAIRAKDIDDALKPMPAG